MNYSQKARPMRVDTPLPEDTLLLEAFEAEEGLSRPYLYTLDLLSEDPEVDPAKLLRKPVLVSIVTEPEQDPFLTHGLIRSFVQLEMAEGLARYRAEVVPAFWFLTQTVDCKIFQNMTVLEIVADVLENAGSVGAVKHLNRCSRSYPKREFCVQYRESAFNFVSRLLEDEGIFYWFEHTQNDHTLVLADGHTTFKPLPQYQALRMDPKGAPGEQVVRSFVHEHGVGSYEVMLLDYDPLQPSLKLDGTERGSDVQIDPVFDYPGLFTEKNDGEYLARVELERREKGRHRVTGTSSVRGLRSGFVVETEGHFRDSSNRSYYLDRIRHSAHSGAFRAWNEAGFHYSNEFTAFPDDLPFRADRAARRPLVRGTQTAMVVGKKGEEVWVDEHGRVKVQFHWDKYGKNDENSSCWIRVSTQTAGKNWGHIEIPRIGHEVIVDFLEGNPDRPIIVGSVYNAEAKPPYPLPEKGVVSGIKTRSSKGGGGYNELIMDDEKDKELIRMHAQRNHQEKVLRDESRWIGQHQIEVIKGSRGAQIEGESKISMDETKELGDVETKGKWKKPVGDVLVVDSNRFVHVKKEQDVEADKGHSLTVLQGDIVETAKNGDITTEANTGDISTLAKMGDITIKASLGEITIEAMKKITLKCGMSKLVMEPASIKLSSVQAEMKGQATAEVSAAAMTTVKASGMVQVQGGIVKIN